MRREALLAATLLVSGCAGSSGDARGSGGDATMRESGLAATVEVKLQAEEVRFLLHVTNTTSSAKEFMFPSSQRYDFTVYDAEGERVWRWSDGMAFLQAISHATLAPGETWEFEVVWDPGNRTGLYQVVGEVTADEHDLQQSASFELP